MMENLIEQLHEGDYSCVIENGGVIRSFAQRGVADLYDLSKTDLLRGAAIADKVVGKGAAALMIQGGVREVYADLISESAYALLADAGVEVSYKQMVHHIENRDKTDWCPLEKSCRAENSVSGILPIIDSFMATVRGKFALMMILASLFLGSPVWAQESVKDTLSIPEVVVTGTRNAVDVRHLPMSVSVVGTQQIERRYEPSLLPVLTEQVPGLFTTARGVMGYGVSTGGSGGMSMRGVGGSPTTGMLVLIDGHPQYMGLMGHPISDAYQSMMAEKVEVVRGPASVLYGSNAMGGVINILTQQHQQDGFKGGARVGYGSFNTLNSEVSGRYHKKGFSSVVTGSYNRSDGHRERMGFEQYGGYAKVGYEFSAHWNAFADVNVTHFNASNPGMENRPIFDNDSKITRGMTSFSLENNYERTSGALKVFYNWGRHNINDGYYEGGTPRDFLFHSKDQMLGVTWYQSASLFEGNRLTVGVDYQQFGGNAWNAFLNGTTSDIADKTERNMAGYVDFRQSLGQIITLDAGVRVDHHSVTGTYLIPQFGASIYPTKTGEIKLLASRGFRNPTIREMYMFPPQNPGLKPESLWNYELSWSQRLWQSRLSYGVNLFYINGENMIQTVQVEGRPLNINTGKIENWGAELSAFYRLCPALSVLANYSYLHMENAVLAAPEHKLYAGINFTKGRWSASTGLQYVAGLYTSIEKEATSQEDFVLWNLRGAFRATKWFELFAKGENLLNQKYEINLGFPMPGATVMGGVNINF